MTAAAALGPSKKIRTTRRSHQAQTRASKSLAKKVKRRLKTSHTAACWFNGIDRSTSNCGLSDRSEPVMGRHPAARNNRWSAKASFGRRSSLDRQRTTPVFCFHPIVQTRACTLKPKSEQAILQWADSWASGIIKVTEAAFSHSLTATYTNGVTTNAKQ